MGASNSMTKYSVTFSGKDYTCEYNNLSEEEVIDIIGNDDIDGRTSEFEIKIGDLVIYNWQGDIDDLLDCDTMDPIILEIERVLKNVK